MKQLFHFLINLYFHVLRDTKLLNEYHFQPLLFLIPFGQLLNNVYFSQIGPKIPVIINLENSVFTNVSTKVTDYGLNNALLNVVLEVKLGYQIITPLQEEKKTLEYELLISSSVIEGKVPNFYGGSMESKSTFFEVYFPH